MFKVGNVTVGGHKTVVIAEAGVNHLKDLDIAEKLIATAAEAGADIVKFQTYTASKLTTKDAPRFWQWSGERDADGGQYASYKVLETPETEFTKFLISTCEKYNVEFMSTPFDADAVKLLHQLGCKAYKVASGDITNFPLLRIIAAQKLPIFLSTGASTLAEVKAAVEIINTVNPAAEICIMHCTLCYPTRANDANLRAIQDLGKHFPDYILGFSDHTIGPEIPAASILYDVKAIEKHYTYDNTLPDSADHWLSIDQKGLTDLCRMLRKLESALGNDLKGVEKCEEITRANARRSLVTNGKINKGEKFTHNNLIPKRPGFGISPSNIDDLIGLTCTTDLDDDTVILPDHVEEDAVFKPITEQLLSLSKNV